jgi:hypothetical protein
MLLPLVYSQGAMDFCRTRGILKKDYKAWMMKNTAAIVECADFFSAGVGEQVTKAGLHPQPIFPKLLFQNCRPTC